MSIHHAGIDDKSRFSLEAVLKIQKILKQKKDLKIYTFKQRIIILSSLLFYKSNNINNNNHLNKVDKHLNMFSFRLINLTFTCNELLWSNSISFSFLCIFFSYKGNNLIGESVLPFF